MPSCRELIVYTVVHLICQVYLDSYQYNVKLCSVLKNCTLL